MKKPITRKCLFSGEEFIPKRNNQIFASSHNRNRYHNDINNGIRNHLKHTNNQLMMNYKIGVKLLDGRKSVPFHEEFLKGQGFDFKYFTNFIPCNDIEKEVYHVYDFSFQKIENDNYLITDLKSL